MKVIAIIQGRCGSTRFPNKILEKVKGKPLIELYIDRVKHSKHLDDIILATTTNPKDAIFEQILPDVNVFRGSENDLLDRYYKCAMEHHADVIVRLTSDDAFVDPDVIDKAIEIFKDNLSAHFVVNHFKPTYPEGLDIELYPRETLSYLWEHATKKYQREHVFPYINDHMEKFNIINFENNIDYSKYRWTVDYECDLTMVKHIYDHLYVEGKIFKMNDIIKVLESHPEIAEINSHINRKEGVNKSIKEEQ